MRPRRHTHGTHFRETGPDRWTEESLLDLLDAILRDDVVLCEEVGDGAARDWYALDLRDPGAIEEELTDPHGTGRIRLLSFSGRADREFAAVRTVRSMSELTAIHAYFTHRNGERQSVCESEEAARRDIEELRDADAEERWTIESERLQVPNVAAASVFDSPDGNEHYWHAVWTCPHCSDEHVTDIESGAAFRELWFCERGLGLAIVHWAGM